MSDFFIKAIETEYAGCLFRSRLEARYAVFFDTMCVQWQYEIEGFEFDGERYLPDFFLPKLALWVEVKPTMPSDDELAKLAAFSEAIKKRSTDKNDDPCAPVDDFVIVVGVPGNHKVFEYRGEWHQTNFGECQLCGRLVTGELMGDSQEASGETWWMLFCEWCDIMDRNEGKKPGVAYFSKGDVISKQNPFNSRFLEYALKTARQARFEHGETPQRY